MRLSVSRNSNVILQYQSPQLNFEDKYEVFIGRSADCHILLDDQLISRHHAVIRYENGEWTINKLSSFGGMIINGINQESYKLNLNDVINVNDFIIKIEDLALPSKKEEVKIEENIVTEEIDDDQENGNDLSEETDIIEPTTDEDDLAVEEVQEDTDIFSDGSNEDSDLDDSSSDAFGDTENESFSDEGSADSFSDDGFGEQGDGFSDDGFGDEAGGFGGAEDEGSTRVLSSFASFSLILKGKYAPFDRYTIEDNEIIIGRDAQKCQIILDDGEVSSTHAKLKKSLVNLVIEDLDSSNGTIVNGSRVNKVELSNGDEIQIGSTLIKVAISSDLLDQEESMLMPVEDDQEIEVEEIIEEEVDFEDGDFDGEYGDGEYGDDFSSGGAEEKSILKNPQKRKKLIYAVVGILLVWALLDSEEKPAGDGGKPGEQKTTQKDNPSNEDSKNNGAATEAKQEPTKQEVQYSKEQIAFMEQHYMLGKTYLGSQKFAESKSEFDQVMSVNPNYKDVQQLSQQARMSFEKIEEERRKAEEKIRLAERNKKIEALVERAREAVKDKQVEVSEKLFADILKLDPENLEVPRLKLEIEAWQKQEELKRQEEERKKVVRQKKVEKLKPGKNAYLAQQWHKAIILLTNFLDLKDMDKDLIEDATKMLIESKRALKDKLAPILGRARSLKEGQDLKGAYEAYLNVLDIDPANEEALVQIEEIKSILNNRSKKLYREALIDESLSLFKQAKEKFQEVQQISPIDSDYYKKATEKLRTYLE